MTYEQIMNLLDKGMQPDQIMEVMRSESAQPEPAEPAAQPEQPAQHEPAQQPEQPAQDTGNAQILAALDRLTKTVQAAALFSAKQPEQPAQPTPSDILMNTISAFSGRKENNNG